ncbi:hypothetical protein [Rouxiella sp. WC2420]|uniref:Uncharacterized protein n=1 Tax=Rouxiella sp. WC2420 TaxID=3234145 RepID=A0AB39VM93_9GAMM
MEKIRLASSGITLINELKSPEFISLSDLVKRKHKEKNKNDEPALGLFINHFKINQYQTESLGTQLLKNTKQVSFLMIETKNSKIVLDRHTKLVSNPSNLIASNQRLNVVSHTKLKTSIDDLYKFSKIENNQVPEKNLIQVEIPPNLSSEFQCKNDSPSLKDHVNELYLLNKRELSNNVLCSDLGTIALNKVLEALSDKDKLTSTGYYLKPQNKSGSEPKELVLPKNPIQTSKEQGNGHPVKENINIDNSVTFTFQHIPGENSVKIRHSYPGNIDLLPSSNLVYNLLNNNKDERFFLKDFDLSQEFSNDEQENSDEEK